MVAGPEPDGSTIIGPKPAYVLRQSTNQNQGATLVEFLRIPRSGTSSQKLLSSPSVTAAEQINAQVMKQYQRKFELMQAQPQKVMPSLYPTKIEQVTGKP